MENQAPSQAQSPQPPTATAKTSGLAIASLVLGICSLCVPLFAPILAIVFGGIALSRISDSRGALRGFGLAVAGIVCGATLGIMSFMIFVLAGMLLPAIAVVNGKARMVKCQNNLKQLSVALMQYVDTHGGGRYYPYPTGKGIGEGGDDYHLTGAQFLVSLYWGSNPVVTEPGLFICPSSSDDNHFGVDLGSEPGPVPPHACSYASRGTTKTPLSFWPLQDRFPPNTVLACDDTEGPAHHDGMNVLFFDTHVEFFDKTKLNPNDAQEDPESCVGRTHPVDVLEN